jgi:hypothetical protein
MSLPYPLPSWFDGDYTVATPADALPTFESPIPAYTTELVLKQDFVQYRNNFVSLPQGTPHPDYPTFYLAQEGERKHQLGGVVRWTRTYVALPATYSEMESFAYSFIGYTGAGLGQPTIGALSSTLPFGRYRMSKKVACRNQIDFFLAIPGQTYTLPASDPRNPTGVPVIITGPGSIPIVQAQAYRFFGSQNAFYVNGWADTDYLVDVIAAFSVFASTPSRTTYQTWVANAAVYGFDPTFGGTISYNWNPGPPVTVNITSTGAHPCQIAVDDSQISRFMGPVWQRSTRYVLAA